MKRVSQRSAESRGFSPGTPCFLPQGKLTGWVRHIYTVWRQIINEVWTNNGCSSAICKLKVYLGLLHVSPVDLSNHNVKLLQFSVCCHGSSNKLPLYLEFQSGTGIPIRNSSILRHIAISRFIFRLRNGDQQLCRLEIDEKDSA